MKRAGWLWFVALLPALAFGEAGRTGGAVLTRTLGARAEGVGEAMTADSGDLDDFSYNPAGLARLPAPALSATYQHGLVDDSFGFVNYAQATHFGAWFAGASGLDAGTIDINQSDGTQGTRHAEQDVLGTAGMAFGRRTPVAFGFSGKFLRSDLAEEATAVAFAGDAGFLWRTPLPGFRLGAAIQNAGSNVKYEVDSDPLPETERVGAAYVLDLQDNLRIPEAMRCQYAVLVDGLKLRDENVSANAGIEIRRNFGRVNVPNWVALRAGYVGATQSIALGVGFQVSGISIDYAFDIVNEFDNTNRVTLGYHFSPDPTVVRDRRPGMPHVDDAAPR